ncbi:hypothetical protein L204_105600 [Cryptococcus depauperatus]
MAYHNQPEGYILVWDGGWCVRVASVAWSDHKMSRIKRLRRTGNSGRDFPYGEIDQLYGWKAFEDHDGFTAAQAMLNVVEVLLAVGYLYLRHTKPAGEEGQSCHATAPLSISAVGVIQGIMIGIPIGLYGSFQTGKARQVSFTCGLILV